MGIKLDEEKINGGTMVSKLSGSFFKAGAENADKNWLADLAAPLLDQVEKVGRDITNYLKSVVGGAKVVFEKVTAGDWGFFKKWFDEAPLIPKLAGTGAALLSGAVVLFVGGAVIGGVAGSIKATLAGLGMTKALLLANVMPDVMGAVVNAGEWVYNFNWAAPDSSLVDQCKEAINRVWEPLGSSMGEALACVVVGRFGKAFGAPTVDVDLTMAAYFSIINPSLQDQIIDALADLLTEVKSIAYEIIFLQTYKGVRQLAGKITGNEDWGDDDQQPFIISEKVENYYETLKASDYLGHLTEEHWEGIEAFGESFMDTLGDLLQEEDTYLNWVKR